ncbi:MFS transporter [Streptomyces coacervatus]|nr:MFS transporter [Streptomyces coacervatus]MDF2272056.1 MFS transporter [Streptomyces coacervatus]
MDATAIYVAVGLLLNSAFAALMSVGLALHLDGLGASKAHIALFFVLNALGSAALNLTLGRWMIRRGSRRGGISANSAMAAAGMWGMSLAHPAGLDYLLGLTIVCSTVNYPQYISIAASGTGSASRRISTARTLCVVGYLGGLGLFSLAIKLNESVTPVRVAAVVAVLNAILAWLPRKEGLDTESDQKHTKDDADRARIALGILISSASAVLLLRSVDNLRQVYLPLYAVSNGISESKISTLIALTSVVEIPALLAIGFLADKTGSRKGLVVVALIGAVSFVPLACGGSYPWLLLAQIAYAPFTAGFQSLAIVLMGEVLPAGIKDGAIAYMVLVQVGSMFGILAPLLVPGYTSEIFFIAVLSCLAATLLLAHGARTQKSGAEMREARPIGRK